MNDKMEILGSPLKMYSLLRDEYNISILNDNGDLNIFKLENMLKGLANMGANGIRVFPFWIHDINSVKISPDYRCHTNYFTNQRLIAKYCSKYNLKYWFCLFDQIGMEKHKEFNPWKSFENGFYGNDAKSYRYKWIEAILSTFYNLNVGFQLCNGYKIKQSKFLANTFLYLIQHNVKPENIILGIDYKLQKSISQYRTDFKNFKDIVIKELGKEWSKKLKSSCISIVYNTTTENVKELWGDKINPGGTQKFLYSIKELTSVDNPVEIILKIKTKAREKNKVNFEVIYDENDFNLKNSSYINYISHIYKEIWERYPENWKKYETQIDDVHPLVNDVLEKKIIKSNNFFFLLLILIIIFLLVIFIF